MSDMVEFFECQHCERACECDGYKTGYREGADEERARIVAWLRRGDECCVANAERILKGEHLK